MSEDSYKKHYHRSYKPYLEEEVAQELGIPFEDVREVTRFIWAETERRMRNPIEAKSGLRIGHVFRFPIAYIRLVRSAHNLMRGKRNHRINRLTDVLEVVYRIEPWMPARYKKWRLKKATEYGLEFDHEGKYIKNNQYAHSEREESIEGDDCGGFCTQGSSKE